MENDNNIKNFTAFDIEKYHRGLLSPKEMHAIEKAALDDPFLSDALEGYAVAGVNVNADITDLKRRLAGKSEQARVIPMRAKGGGSSFPWLRAAAIVILIAGAGLLAYQFLFKSTASQNEIAQAPEKTEKPKTTESKISPQADNPDSSRQTSSSITLQDSIITPGVGIKPQQQKTVTGELSVNNKSITDTLNFHFGLTSKDGAVVSAPSKAEEDKIADDAAKRNLDKDISQGKSDIALKDENKNPLLRKQANKDAEGAVAMQEKAKEVTVTGYGATRRNQDFYSTINTNIFRGRITDANNNALPFANITNTRDNVGTYSDARGNFTLVSTDTVLNVQVRSLGFENNNVQLRNYVPDNQVMMREDRNLAANILDTVKRNSNRDRNTSMKFEEPEPVIGWAYYDTYLWNNLNVPETFETKKAGGINEVQVSFEVNKDGEPVNIKIEKSLCDKCDKEAIRLIKEGPKWKRKAKKGRTTVTVPFPQ